MIQFLVAAFLLSTLGLAYARPATALAAWILVLETSPDSWAAHDGATREAIIGAMKSAGLAIALGLALRTGTRRDRYNPAFAFIFMFFAGLLHGLYPGLSALSSLRSLTGSAGPFLFAFTRMEPPLARTVQHAAAWGPPAAACIGTVLALVGFGHVYVFQQGALRFGAGQEPAFLAGYALIGLYAALMLWLDEPRPRNAALALANLLIILLTGARAPLALGLALGLAVLVMQRRILVLAAAGALACLGALFLNALGFLRVVDLARLGEAADLSNRNLVWPYFERAFSSSPLTGWGVGAGKVIIPLNSPVATLIGTNAAHDEYLRIAAEGGALGLLLLTALFTLWVTRGTAAMQPRQKFFMRLVFIGFAIHSATDNTLIATTASVFFLWVCACFANAANEATRAA